MVQLRKVRYYIAPNVSPNLRFDVCPMTRDSTSGYGKHNTTFQQRSRKNSGYEVILTKLPYRIHVKYRNQRPRLSTILLQSKYNP